jgi:hypothetical protein
MTIGTRGTVTGSAPVFGGFTIKQPQVYLSQRVHIAVRGPSLQSLGITQNPLDSPRLRVYDAAGTDLIHDGNQAGVASCPASSATAQYYSVLRGQPLDGRDSCVLLQLPGGVYTFSISPASAHSDGAGEVLFEVSFNPDSGMILGGSVSTIGSRGAVSGAAAMYGGFTLDHNARVAIAVRGPSLQTLGITQNPLDAPGLRLYDASGKDLLLNSSGGAGVATCPATNSTAVYYANVRGQPLHARDSCIAARVLEGGVYTFSIVPTSSDPAGEVLFEVTFDYVPGM